MKITKNRVAQPLLQGQIGPQFSQKILANLPEICSTVEPSLERATAVLGVISGTRASGARSAPVPLPFRTGSAKSLIEKD